MPLVTSTEMFKKAYEGHYAVGAFNVNNMEIIQGKDGFNEMATGILVKPGQRSSVPSSVGFSAGNN